MHAEVDGRGHDGSSPCSLRWCPDRSSTVVGRRRDIVPARSTAPGRPPPARPIRRDPGDGAVPRRRRAASGRRRDAARRRPAPPARPPASDPHRCNGCARVIGGGVVVQHRGDDGRRDTPPLAGLSVDEPDLEVALWSDLREQGCQVVGEVVGRWPVADPALPPVPAAARSGTSDPPVPSRIRDERRIIINGASSAQRVQAAGRSSPGVARRDADPGRVEVHPDGLPGALPSGRPPVAARRSWQRRPPGPDRWRAAGPSVRRSR